MINYNIPKNIEQYTHRIGCTGQAGESGLATSYFTNEDHEILFDLKKMLKDTKNPVPLELATHPEAQMKPGTFVTQSQRDCYLCLIKTDVVQWVGSTRKVKCLSVSHLGALVG